MVNKLILVGRHNAFLATRIYCVSQKWLQYSHIICINILIWSISVHICMVYHVLQRWCDGE